MEKLSSFLPSANDLLALTLTYGGKLLLALFFAMNEKVKKTFDQQFISFPVPQMDIHLYRE